MKLTSHAGGALALWTTSLPDEAVGLAWLGQAGFALRYAGCRLLIDPYLSDFLAEKYRGQEFSYARTGPPPILPAQARHLDWVLCSHRHSDHLDPGSLPVLSAHNPRCRFMVPSAVREAALTAGLPRDHIVGVNAGNTVPLSDGLTAQVIASAHESLQVNAQGEHHFLGFILKTRHLTVYHCGDCVPYDGLAAELCRHQVDLALLPVNGRDARRARRGVPGNMTFDEALELCRQAGIPRLIPHHFGMFSFNTVDPAELQRQAGRGDLGVLCSMPAPDRHFLLGTDSREPAPL